MRIFWRLRRKSHLVVGLVIGLIIAGSTTVVAQSNATHDSESVESLAGWISNRISQPKYDGAFWGIRIDSLATGRVLFQHNAGKLFSPASNMKMFTVAAALDRLGAEYQIRTSIQAHARPDSTGVLEGDLIIYGRGDPTLTPRLHGGNLTNALRVLVETLKKTGLHKVTGDLVGDITFFHGPEYGSGWSWDDLEYYYGAEISALSINDNIIKASVLPAENCGERCTIEFEPFCDYLILSNRTETLPAGASNSIRFYRSPGANIVFTSGGLALGASNVIENIPIHEPARLYLSLFRAVAQKEGIEIAGKTRVLSDLEGQRAIGTRQAELIELGSANSLTLSNIAREILKPSQNLYADLLLAHLGEHFRKSSDSIELSSEQLGIREVSGFVKSIAIRPEEYYFEEGSGLSRDTLVTPNAIIALLKQMKRHRESEAFIQSLPVAAVDGSLRARMRKTAAAGNVQAKTGSLHWASTLSGYVQTVAGEPLVFALMLNRYEPPPGASSREDLDAIAVKLAGFTGETK